MLAQQEDNSINELSDPDPSVHLSDNNEAVQFKSRRSLFTSLNTGSMQAIRKSNQFPSMTVSTWYVL